MENADQEATTYSGDLMDVLDIFGRPVASYEGRISVGALEEGYFEHSS